MANSNNRPDQSVLSALQHSVENEK